MPAATPTLDNVYPFTPMHNAHIITTGACALTTIEHIESVPHTQGLAYYAIQAIYDAAVARLQRCKSALRADTTFKRIAHHKRNEHILNLH